MQTWRVPHMVAAGFVGLVLASARKIAAVRMRSGLRYQRSMAGLIGRLRRLL